MGSKKLLTTLRRGGGAPAPVTRGIEGLWLMDEGTGVTAADSGGGGNDMTLGISNLYKPTWVATGLDFAGEVQDHLLVRTWAPDLTAGYTFQCVALYDGDFTIAPGFFRTADDPRVGDEGAQFMLQPASNLIQVGHTNTVPTDTLLSASYVEDTTFYHVYTVRYNGSNLCEVLVDGVSMGVKTDMAVPNRGGMTHVNIGMGTASRSWSGIISIGKLNSEYLTTAEIAQDLAYFKSIMGGRGVTLPFDAASLPGTVVACLYDTGLSWDSSGNIEEWTG